MFSWLNPRRALDRAVELLDAEPCLGERCEEPPLVLQPGAVGSLGQAGEQLRKLDADVATVAPVIIGDAPSCSRHLGLDCFFARQQIKHERGVDPRVTLVRCGSDLEPLQIVRERTQQVLTLPLDLPHALIDGAAQSQRLLLLEWLAFQLIDLVEDFERAFESIGHGKIRVLVGA